MEEFAKVEKLVEITGASYEDARNALKACDGEMVDSMVYLEKLGKVTKNVSGNKVDPRFAPISEAEIVAAAARKEAERAARRERCEKRRGAVSEFVRKTMRFLTHNKITIAKDGQEFASIPLLVAIIICSISVGFVLVAAFVSMMFGYEYSFTGESNLETANKVLAQAGSTAGQVKAEYDRL